MLQLPVLFLLQVPLLTRLFFYLCDQNLNLSLMTNFFGSNAFSMLKLSAFVLSLCCMVVFNNLHISGV